MSHIETFAALKNDLKIDFLLENGELVDGYKEDGLMVYMFILEDFFVCLKTDENSDVTTMKVSRHPQVMEDYIEGVTISDLV